MKNSRYLLYFQYPGLPLNTKQFDTIAGCLDYLAGLLGRPLKSPSAWWPKGFIYEKEPSLPSLSPNLIIDRSQCRLVYQKGELVATLWKVRNFNT